MMKMFSSLTTSLDNNDKFLTKWSCQELKRTFHHFFVSKLWKYNDPITVIRGWLHDSYAVVNNYCCMHVSVGTAVFAEQDESVTSAHYDDYFWYGDHNIRRWGDHISASRGSTCFNFSWTEHKFISVETGVVWKHHHVFLWGISSS